MSPASTSISSSKDSVAAIMIFNKNLVVTKVSQGIDLHHQGRGPTKPKKFIRHKSVLPVQRFDRGSCIQAEQYASPSLTTQRRIQM
jgi:hypothetical protein